MVSIIITITTTIIIIITTTTFTKVSFYKHMMLLERLPPTPHSPFSLLPPWFPTS